MQYSSVTPATFLSRPNRFVARVLLDGEPQTVHRSEERREGKV